MNFTPQQILNELGRVRREPEVISYLLEIVRAEPGITAVVTDLRPDPQEWGTEALHFSGRSSVTGTEVLVKVNAGSQQVTWTNLLSQHAPSLIPTIHATGHRLGPLEMGWIIQDRVEGADWWEWPIFDMLVEAGVLFQRASRYIEGPLREHDPDQFLKRLEEGARGGVPGPTSAILERFDEDWSFVEATCEAETCHGDLHLSNVLWRSSPEGGGTALLIDYYPIRQPWVLDPVKLQILNSAPDRPQTYGLIGKAAAFRERLGMSTISETDLAIVEPLVLAWSAITSWTTAGVDRREKESWRSELERYIAKSAYR